MKIKIFILVLFSCFQFNYAQIHITSPKGGELIGSSPHFIIRYEGASFDSVDIKYSIDNKKSWNDIVWWSANGGGGVYRVAWDVPDVNSDSCFISVISKSDTKVGDTSKRFTIYKLVYDSLVINQIKFYFRNDGDQAVLPKEDYGGLLWPGGKDAKISSVFREGILLGGLVNSEIRISGTWWSSGLIPGNIEEG